MLRALALSIRQLGDRAILAVLAKSVALTLLIFGILGAGAYYGFGWVLDRIGWTSASTGVIAAIGALISQGRRDALTGRSLTQSAGFQGSGGVFRLLANGTNQRGLAIATVRNNQMVILDPAPRSFSGAGF